MKFAMFKLSLAIILPKCRWRHHMHKLQLHIHKDYLGAISKNYVE